MAGADIRTRDISGRQHRAAPTMSPAVWYKTAGGACPRPGKGTSSGPPGHLPLKGKAFAAPFTPPLTGEVSPQEGEGVCLPLEGEVAFAKQMTVGG